MAAAAAGMTAVAASVAAAAVPFAMIVMMIAVEIGIDSQGSVDKGCGNFIHIAGCAADQLDPGFRQRHLCAAADAAADQKINAAIGKQSRQCTVTGFPAGDDFFGSDFTVFHCKNGEFRCMTEVLKDLIVFAGDRKFHNRVPYF